MNKRTHFRLFLYSNDLNTQSEFYEYSYWIRRTQNGECMKMQISDFDKVQYCTHI